MNRKQVTASRFPARRRPRLFRSRVPARACAPASMLACDFFMVETISLRRFYVLFFIELGSRRVQLAGCTTNPSGALGDPAGPQPQLHRGVRADAVPNPRPRQQIHGGLRRGLPQRRHQSDPHPDPCTTSERLRRALRPHRPCRVSRLAAHPRPPPPRGGAARLHGALQPRTPPPRTRSPDPRDRRRGPFTYGRKDPPPGPTGRTHPRVPPSRGVSRTRILKPFRVQNWVQNRAVVVLQENERPAFAGL